RVTLATARDEANERHQSEAYAMNLRLEALRSRAATAEKLLAEGRQTLAARTEDIRGLERKGVEGTIARKATDKVVERLTTARDGLDGKVRELEQGRASLTERSNILAETLKARETSLAHAEQKIKSLTDRIAEIEVDAGAYRAKTERRIDELNASLQRERVELAVAQGALERYSGRAGSAAACRRPRGGLRHRQRAIEIEKRQRRRPRSQGGGDGAGRRHSGAPVHPIISIPRSCQVHTRWPTRGAARVRRLPFGHHSQALWWQGGRHFARGFGRLYRYRASRVWRTAWPAPAATQHRNSGCNTAGCAAGSNKSTRWGSCAKSMARTGTSRWAPSPTCSPKRAAAARPRSCSTTCPAIPGASARSTGSCPPCPGSL